ncbi:FMN-binding negative transcriptional regulator [Acetobacter orleanensis]|uniref:Transcriptional regulator n=1 Tax=Acetobacter orleanensis TaxID=104099 RepID=A0A4Y3TNQ0_9PROT|nr:FMN-binding negative transcriptional regulator [Acetobacter orleanensis]KXV66876.1 hypothetical protein AD949_01310 [Acetobacter orleanensis]PCD78395.1 FMN-binding negative transcriptional regulator [Acetobacter orleanensis]GAN69345.1 transcriptional negative regulator [Acetobacter orleanensis JCM 7639]GBR22048.1 transcriptional regulator [Acetobacter orleanensis NRIC 0473]GEB83966.1 transcriptional regulator [Acetobacter orleanensis]
MYPPPQFKENRSAILLNMIRTLRFGALVSTYNKEQIISHLPVDVEENGNTIWLNTHVSRANPHWQVTRESPTVAIFEGPHAYIRPSWLTAKKLHGKVVPTWNYIAVHAHGTIEAVNEQTWLLEHLAALSGAVEAERPQPWALTDAPADFIDKLLPQIVGIRLRVSKLTGVWKMSQHHSEQNRSEIISGLHAENNPCSQKVASVMSNIKTSFTNNK